MTPEEILQNHARNQGHKNNVLSDQVAEFLKQPNTYQLQENNCVFLVQSFGTSAHVYIMNGGSPNDYMRALKMFVDKMRAHGIKHLTMRVTDKVMSGRIAQSVGVNSVSYKDVGGKIDPYLMTMEL